MKPLQEFRRYPQILCPKVSENLVRTRTRARKKRPSEDKEVDNRLGQERQPSFLRLWERRTGDADARQPSAIPYTFIESRFGRGIDPHTRTTCSQGFPQ